MTIDDLIGHGPSSKVDGPPSTSWLGLHRRRLNGDDGTTLIELMVGMVIMAIFLSMFTGAILLMNGAMNRAQAVNLTSSQLNVAFRSLDKTVSYAAAISTPHRKGSKGDWYVELRTTNTGTEVCTQLRVDSATQQLQRQTWSVGQPVDPPGWLPIASGIVNGDTPPFELPELAGAVSQQLKITLVSQSGSGSPSTNSTSSYTFTALNSVVPPTSPICDPPGRR